MSKTTPLILALLLLLPSCSSNDVSADVGPLGDASSSDRNTADDTAATDCERWILAGEVTNARDVAGLTITSGKIACGRLFRGGDLGRLTANGGCAELANLGIKTVIDLREEGAQQAGPPADCVTKQATVVSAAMPKLLPPTEANYLALLQEKTAIAAIFSALGEAGAAPAYIHCVIGRDRASFATALVLLAAGAEQQAVVDEFLLSNEAGINVEKPWLEAVLDEIDKAGGIDAFLATVGVKPAQLEALRQQL